MTAGHVPGVCAIVEQDLLLARDERPHDDLGIVPAPQCLLKREEHRSAAGQHLRELYAYSPSARLVTVSGVPPDDATRHTRIGVWRTRSRRHRPSWRRQSRGSVVALAAAPRCSVGHRRVGTRRISRSVQKPIHAPSGEKKGFCAPSVPGMGAASRRSSGRRNNCQPSWPTCWPTPRMPLKTSVRPSGDTAMAVRKGPPIGGLVSPALAAGR